MTARVILAIAVGAVVAGCGQSRHERTGESTVASGTVAKRATSCASYVLDDEGIGSLRLGMSVDSVRSYCTVSRDTVATDMEGMPSRRLLVSISDDTVQAEIVSNKVWRLSVWSRRFQTSDSLGVGTPISRFKSTPGARVMTGEGSVYAAVPGHCGMSFQLTGFKPVFGKIVLQNLPPSVEVLSVLIFGCHLAGS